MPKNKLTSESIIDNLIKIRDINGWTNYKIAAKCDLPSATVSNIFKKQSVPQLDTLLALCRGLGISFSYLDKSEKHTNLSESDIELLQMWEILKDEEKAAVLEVVKLYIKNRNN